MLEMACFIRRVKQKKPSQIFFETAQDDILMLLCFLNKLGF